MRQYIIRRMFQTIPILFGVSVMIFLIVYSTPGDPYAYLFGPRVDPKVKAKLKEEMGLNDPLPFQYVRWLRTTMSGDLGYSLRTQQRVTDMLGTRLGPTFILSATALLIAILVAIPIGVLSATRQYSLFDYSATSFAFMGISLPTFFTGILAVFFFAVKFQWFPMNQMATPGAPFSLADRLHHLVLPALVLGAQSIAQYTRFTRASLLEVLRQDYVRTARSKGLAERVVVYKHALRNGLIPIVTLLGFSLPGLFGGAIITETIFTWPGMGLLTIEAVGNRDYPVLMATNMFFAALTILGNLLADILYAVVDPRIRYS